MVVAHLPIEDNELDFVGLTNVDASVECLGVEKMATHVEVDQ
jgi:hypothetical protein